MFLVLPDNCRFPHDRVYFIYDTPCFFERRARCWLILWLAVKIAHPQITNYREASLRDKLCFRPTQPSFITFLFSLFLLSPISILGLQTGAHRSIFPASLAGVSFGSILRDWHAGWKPAMLGFCAALSFQVLTGLWNLPHNLLPSEATSVERARPVDPSMRGISVVQLSDGFRILRA